MRSLSEILQVDPARATAAVAERGEVAGGLRANQAPEPERPPGDPQLLAGVVDDLDEDAVVRAALVQLPGGVEVAWAPAARDHGARRLAGARGEPDDPLLG